MFSAAQTRTGMDWPSIWQALTGERVEDVAINAIRSSESTTQVDFVELFNPGNFKAQKGTLNAGTTYDVKVDPQSGSYTYKCSRSDTTINCTGGSTDFDRGSAVHCILSNAEYQSKASTRSSLGTEVPGRM